MEESASQVLYDYVLWQQPIKLVVTIAFYAFAFKLGIAILRYLLLTLIGFRRWVVGENSLQPDHPREGRLWRYRPREEKGEQESVGRRRQSMANTLLNALYVWLVGGGRRVQVDAQVSGSVNTESRALPLHFGQRKDY